ncbi:MAG: thiamine pyrophosphate-dependent enzyme, partial [Syntrophales bacterium]|nr:thiamine pyrophosphate-dependent enzyme [Syntrophales bacterium]
DSRPIAKWMDIPLLEPGDFQEAKDMTKWLFDLSEELSTICMLRSVTRVAHARGNVTLGALPVTNHVAYFDQLHDLKNVMPTRYMPIPSPLRHFFLHMRLKKAQEKFEESPFNRYEGPDTPDLLIITCGSCWLYSREAVKLLELDKRVGVLKLGTLWPLPEKLIRKYLDKASKVLFVEEIDPFIENGVMEIAANMPADGSHPVFYGKGSGHINAFGEQNPDTVTKAIAGVLGLSYLARDAAYAEKADAASKEYVSERTLTFCAGCPHRASFWSIKNALKLDGRGGIVTGDIGCYTMGLIHAGFFQVRTVHSMGSGVGVANGLGKLGQFGFTQPVLAVVGDSTFFHATIPALINGIYNQSNFIIVVLDNSATAMTGFQPHPGIGTTAMGNPTSVVSIEALCKAVGAHVEVCDPFDLKGSTQTLQKMIAEGGGAKVVIMRRQCELVRGKREKPPYKVHVVPEKCIGEACGCNRLCTRIFLCPGLIWDKKSCKSKIDEVICNGCGVCTDICPQGAIVKEAK